MISHTEDAFEKLTDIILGNQNDCDEDMLMMMMGDDNMEMLDDVADNYHHSDEQLLAMFQQDHGSHSHDRNNNHNKNKLTRTVTLSANNLTENEQRNGNNNHNNAMMFLEGNSPPSLVPLAKAPPSSSPPVGPPVDSLQHKPSLVEYPATFNMMAHHQHHQASPMTSTVPEERHLTVLPPVDSFMVNDTPNHSYQAPAPSRIVTRPKRQHKRAATDGSFGFLYRQLNDQQQQKHPRLDPLNAMAQDFIKQEHELLTRVMNKERFLADQKEQQQNQKNDQQSKAKSGTAGAAPAPTFHSSLNFALASFENFAAPATTTVMDRDMDMNMNMNKKMPAAAPMEAIIMDAAAPSLISVTAKPSTPSVVNLEFDQDEDEDDDDEYNLNLNHNDSDNVDAQPQPQPTRLSRFLDSLQAQVDRDNAVLRQQMGITEEEAWASMMSHDAQPPPAAAAAAAAVATARGTKRHRRILSEGGPHPYDGSAFWGTAPAPAPAATKTKMVDRMPSFDMGDPVEDRALFFARHQ